jgi:hypothetical protein
MPPDLPDLGSSIVTAEACLIGRLRLFVDFANVRPSLAVGAELGAVVRLLLRTPRVSNQPIRAREISSLEYVGWYLLLVNLDGDVTSDGVVPATVFTVSFRTQDRPEQHTVHNPTPCWCRYPLRASGSSRP